MHARGRALDLVLERDPVLEHSPEPDLAEVPQHDQVVDPAKGSCRTSSTFRRNRRRVPLPAVDLWGELFRALAIGPVYLPTGREPVNVQANLAIGP